MYIIYYNQQSKIYKLINGTKQYFGSTCNSLARRKAGHIQHYKLYKDGKKNWCYSFEILQDCNFKIELVELYPCQNKIELHKRERYWIENNDSVNKNLPSRTKKEYEQLPERKEYKKEWHLKHKEENNTKAKERYVEKSSELKEYQKNYRNNPDNIEKIKERRSRKELCILCNKEITHANLNKHKKTMHPYQEKQCEPDVDQNISQ
jgi:hypothetical protein